MKTSNYLRALATGPSSHLAPLERSERRNLLRSLRAQYGGSAARSTTLLFHGRAFPHRLQARCNARWPRVMSRLLGASLDRKLAHGQSPDARLLLAARAQFLVSPVHRQVLAHLWGDLVARALRPPGLRDPHAPLNRNAIVASEPAIRLVTAALVAPIPGDVRGIAMLRCLLSDGSGPLYQRGSPIGLDRALREAATHLVCAAT